jgi:hypothetical protein
MFISIFNSFPFHYEVFGVFIDYLVRHFSPCELKIRIYTNQDDKLHWLDFYKSRYPGDVIQYFKYEEFNVPQFNESDYVILPTDDDPGFHPIFTSLPNAAKKLICYDHDIELRTPHIQQHITTRPYPPHVEHRRNTPYLYPVYPIFSLNEKRAALAAESMINVIVVGGTYNTNHYWKYILANNDMNKLRIFYIHRHCPGVWGRMDKYVRSICPNTEIYEDCDTATMYSLLKRSHYLLLLTDVDKFIHTACSGSIGIAFSTGCTMIMPRRYNTDYQFRNALYFEDTPVLTNCPDIDLVYTEQATILEQNEKALSRLITTHGA